MSDSEDSMEAEQRITLHHGGAAMRAEFERRTEVAGDIQKAIKRKERDVVSGEHFGVCVLFGFRFCVISWLIHTDACIHTYMCIYTCIYS